MGKSENEMGRSENEMGRSENEMGKSENEMGKSEIHFVLDRDKGENIFAEKVISLDFT